MFEKEIEELFKLSMRVVNETNSFVEFDVLSHVHICHILGRSSLSKVS